MAKDLDFKTLGPSIKKTLAKLSSHLPIIFVIIVLLGVSYGVYSVNNILITTSDPAYEQEAASQTLGTHFDTTTIKAIDKLGDRQSPEANPLPSGRINPFSE